MSYNVRSVLAQVRFSRVGLSMRGGTPVFAGVSTLSAVIGALASYLLSPETERLICPVAEALADAPVSSRAGWFAVGVCFGLLALPLAESLLLIRRVWSLGLASVAGPAPRRPTYLPAP